MSHFHFSCYLTNPPFSNFSNFTFINVTSLFESCRPACAPSTPNFQNPHHLHRPLVHPHDLTRR
ncbi:unnamed protein product [Tenebrio molitor]|nr:unnamed protein product [Tenebrio molitor]